MKTPLTSVKAYLQLLEMSVDKSNKDAVLYTQKAILSVERLKNLISELLDVNKIQHGQLNFTFSTFDFNEMINNAVEDIQYNSPNHKIIKKGKADDPVYGDKERLQQVVINLLSNAVKYTPPNGTGGIVYQLSQVIPIEFVFKPETILLGSQGGPKRVHGFLEPPPPYTTDDIDVASIRINNVVPVDQTGPAPIVVGDQDNDGIPDLKVYFSRSALEAFTRLIDLRNLAHVAQDRQDGRVGMAAHQHRIGKGERRPSVDNETAALGRRSGPLGSPRAANTG